MKASELIEQLQALVAGHGDLDVVQHRDFQPYAAYPPYVTDDTRYTEATCDYAFAIAPDKVIVLP